MAPKLDDSVEIQPKSYDDNLETQDDVNLEFNSHAHPVDFIANDRKPDITF
tara:strand:+ start:271 stop:423 length:153 start_codon:yes stop_codon:yes gene_type:complete